jgi:hypothetical protein
MHSFDGRSDHVWSVLDTAILTIIEGRFQVFQRFPSSKLALKTVASCFVALNYYENGSMHRQGWWGKYNALAASVTKKKKNPKRHHGYFIQSDCIKII